MIIKADVRDIELPDGLIITDPPYNQGHLYPEYNDNLSEEKYIELLSVIRPPAVVIHYPEETINILSKAIRAKCQEVTTWVYNSNTKKQSRVISWWGCKPDFTKIRQPYKNLNVKKIQDRIANGFEGSRLYDWWEINQVKNTTKEKTNYPNQIPEEVIRRIIKITAQPGETIIDPFSGSGTTGKVATELGFNFIGYDISNVACEIGNKRIENFRSQEKLDFKTT